MEAHILKPYLESLLLSFGFDDVSLEDSLGLSYGEPVSSSLSRFGKLNIASKSMSSSSLSVALFEALSTVG